jgi:Predicted solute binding protein
MLKKRISIILVLSLLLATISTVTVMPVATYAAAPAGWRDIQPLKIFYNATREGWAGSGGCLEVSGTQVPTDTSVTYNSLPSMRYNITGYSSGDWWLDYICFRDDWGTLDITKYVSGGSLEFYIKGDAGGESFKIGLQDAVNDRSAGTNLLNLVTVGAGSYVTVTTSWQKVTIPLTDIITSQSGLVSKQMRNLVVMPSDNPPSTEKFWLNDVKITYATGKEPAYPNIKVNQEGYKTNQPKIAIVSGFEDIFAATTSTAFQVKNASDGSVVYSGTLTLKSDYDAASGERVFNADFSSLTTAGQYYISLSLSGAENSPVFTIDDSVYSGVLGDLVKFYYYHRADIAIGSPYVTDYPHPAYHSDDYNCPLASDSSITKDVSGGWYDAGDTVKPINAGALAAAELLYAYEMFPTAFGDNTNIPESGNGIPDLLDEVKCELNYIMKMQDSASGGFYSSVISNGDQLTGARQICDLSGSTGQVKGTPNTADAVAILAHAYTVFQSIDSSFASTCLSAALNGWTYLQNNLSCIPIADGSTYQDSEDLYDRMWAAGSLYKATGNANYGGNYFVAHYNDSTITTKFTGGNDYSVYIGMPWLYAYFQYMKASNLNSSVVSYFNTNFDTWKQDKVSRYNNNTWSTLLSDSNMFWGCLQSANQTALGIAVGSQICGTYDDAAKNVVRGMVNFCLGANPLNISFISGEGTNSTQDVFSNIFGSDGLAGIPKGFMPCGINPIEGSGYSPFPLKCFADVNSDWAVAEQGILANSSVVFNVALASIEGGSGATPTPTATGSATPTPTQTPTPTTTPTTTPTPTPTPTTTSTLLFTDGFESNNFTGGGWTNSGCDLQTTYKYAGTYAARFNSSDSLTKAISTSGYSDIQVSYARYTRSCETDDHFIAEWYNGSAWTALEDLTGNSSWTVMTWSLPSGAGDNASFQLRFRTSHNGSSDYAYLDSVLITGTSSTATPTPTPTLTPTPTPTPGDNLVLGKTATMLNGNDRYNPVNNAIDGNSSTYAQSDDDVAWDLSVDLGSSYSISRIVVNTDTSNYATQYTLQISTDGTNWTTVATETNGNGTIKTYTFTSVSARYVKMDVTAEYGGYAGLFGHAIRELGIYAQ